MRLAYFGHLGCDKLLRHVPLPYHVLKYGAMSTQLKANIQYSAVNHYVI